MKPDILESLRREAARKSPLDADKDTMERAAAEIARLREALGRIAALEPIPFEFPADWSEQIAACSECQRYKDHPIQQGICDTHRRPIWDRESHDKFERGAIGYRAKEIARNATTSGGRAP